MAVLRTRVGDRSTVIVLASVGVILGVIVLAFLAWTADLDAVAGSPAAATLDLAVGFAFMMSSIPAAGTTSQRLLTGAVGPAWIAGSVFASARSLHQSVLVIALLSFPAGRLHGVPRRLLGAGAVVVAFEVVPQPAVAALFAAVAVVAFGSADRIRVTAVFPAVAGIAVAAVLLISGWADQRATVQSPLVLYEATLIAVAVGFPLATRAASRSRARLADLVLGDTRLAGLPGLQLVLAEVLDDPDLKIDFWDPTRSAYLDPANDHEFDHDRSRALPSKRKPTPGKRELNVFDGALPLARVVTRSPAVADRPTNEGISAAVRLAVINGRLRDQQQKRVADLEAARVRLLVATDRERERVAASLQAGAGAYLQEAQATLATASLASDPDLSELIGFAVNEVSAAATEVQRILGGVPPMVLGSGALQAAIGLLAGRSLVPVTVNIADDAAADTAGETTLFYVCSEALANVSKHSGATRVCVDLRRHGNELLLSVRDDGRGGADRAGFGLLGLADRLAAAGGHLTVSSPPGEGTTLTAVVPRPPS